jgi:hypothetical protein
MIFLFFAFQFPPEIKSISIPTMKVVTDNPWKSWLIKLRLPPNYFERPKAGNGRKGDNPTRFPQIRGNRAKLGK